MLTGLGFSIPRIFTGKRLGFYFKINFETGRWHSTRKRTPWVFRTWWRVIDKTHQRNVRPPSAASESFVSVNSAMISLRLLAFLEKGSYNTFRLINAGLKMLVSLENCFESGWNRVEVQSKWKSRELGVQVLSENFFNINWKNNKTRHELNA